MTHSKKALAVSGALAVLASVAIPTAGNAQTPADTSVIVNTAQSLLSAQVGNGVTPHTTVVSVVPNGAPVIGIGALSANPDHYGSTLSVSLLNSQRLLGVDGVGGYTGGQSISIDNPRHAPILSAPAH